MTFTQTLSIRWADLDPNFHVRHSAYYDYAAALRINILAQLGLTPQVLQQLQIGPIIWREECVFKREIRLTDQVVIDSKLRRARRDFSRWSIRHQLTRTDGTLCAEINIDGAWLDTSTRKLAQTPPQVHQAFGSLPQTDDFEWMEEQ